ncbi:phospholipase C [Dyadobacter jejuensis]|uniref:phospholipase C n=1 Tax=Dyadobacter jejuensis TaxID=1082580 RepID=A0A316AJ89_9BACT|nr:phospholipase C, phosphocholine-specific [Dyadobacter jejuensis]PWJ57875.1 phospholipase C [Dyadobacter jejuensis]
MESRRDFLKKASIFSGALGLSGMIPESIQRAMAINPAPGTTYLDAEHVVFLMQENRSFDHALGTLKGVRGYNDPRAITLPNKNPVWLQSNKKGETYGPFRFDIKETKATWMKDLPHGWNDQVDSLNKGNMDGWLEAKRSHIKDYSDMPLTMGYYTREDIPFYYNLADSFTVCDHNFCSSLTGTSPNRCFFWTGTIREEQHEDAKPHISNSDIDGAERVFWNTFPERLSSHGVDWRIYQNELSVGVGFEGEEGRWLANFTDNDLEFFKQYHVKRHPEHLPHLYKEKASLEKKLKEKPNAKLQEKLDYTLKEIAFLETNTLDTLTPEQRDLHQRAFTINRNDPDYHSLETITYNDNGIERTAAVPKGDVLHQFREDVNADKLPTVSWLVPPCNFSDHAGTPWYGAWFLSEAIDILTKNPEVWKKTIFILTYDENDGYFDHIPPVGTPNPKDPATGLVSESLDISAEYVKKGLTSRENSIGLGFRVPMMVVSPWSRGGYVNSQVFDHTSSIQFLEHFLSHKTGEKIYEDNISSWRRSICGDLTSVFRPYNGEPTPLPTAIDRIPFIEGIHKAQFARVADDFIQFDQQMIAKVDQYLPQQEKGIKAANTIPYEAYAHGSLDQGQAFALNFTAGKQVFGEASSGIGYYVYAPEGKTWTFTAAAGDTINYQWPLANFANGQYDLKVHSANGFFRHYRGNAQDPGIRVELLYGQKGDAKLRVLRTSSNDAMEVLIRDNSYGQKPVKKILAKNEGELMIPVDLKASHSWYDLTLTVEGYADYSQQFAGHVEHAKESFTDPLMGRML